MGLILKFRSNQQDQWNIFYRHIFDVFREGKMIAFPWGKAGYGLAGDPSNPSILQIYWDLYGENFVENVIFIGDSIKTLSQWGLLSDLAIKVAELYWPGDLVIHVPFIHLEENPLQEQIFSANPELETSLLQRSVYLLVPRHPVAQNFFSYLIDHGYPPLLMGNFAAISSNFNAQDAVTVMNEFGNEYLGVVADAGRLQKSKKVYPATQVAIFDEDFLQIEIEGLISEANIFDSFPNLNLEKDEF